ncbi:hypothetical protein QE197_22140 (plasmid) [Arsenophonus nasoniae]|uniref:Uncharacterized protein n=1 Tax=Arsenophonus nasoniae TaxID=638 RepID=D2U0T1_9GAMM|nr:hypothetical protein [Arsenophonus nasoniae]QBY46574.1 hypothetical protein ArsFIN_51850 [Arsenophonus nasoniae]WGM08412.1 hypothetical protein QE258_23570 [Arsenophonus nasoniae]WGM13276.1 hypothetical protein QE197_22140 [Arsenophonus nasoniae]WGM17936.1 hypothetical protein QE193_22020 [Arsenophonus nasoniae]CBA74082.1 conserved hypothetical protein [Arsenophonus nasoniae]
MKPDENKNTIGSSFIAGKEKKFKLDKKKGRYLIVLIVVLVAVAALLYLKPTTSDKEIPETVDFYSDLDSSVAVFKSEDKKDPQAQTATSESTPAPEANASSTELPPALEANKAAESASEANAGSTELTPDPDAFKKDYVTTKEQQEKQLSDLYHNAINGKTSEQDSQQNISYEGQQVMIPYNEGEQTKIYLYKNFSVKIFLGKQKNQKDITTLDYFINGSDDSDSYKLRLLPNNVLLLSKNTNVESWGGTDLFVTTGGKNYTFILLNATTPSERTDSIRYISNTKKSTIAKK